MRLLRVAAIALVVVPLAVSSACGSDDATEPPVTEPPVTGPADAPTFDESLVVGLPVDEAEAGVEDEGWVFRIAVIDGEDQVLTADYVENRVNVVVTDGVVESISFVG